MDVCGPFQEPSLGRSMYLATFVDDFSSLSVVCPIKAKSDVAGVTMDVINMLEKQSGWPLLVVRTDNGSEYINSELATFFKDKGVIHQTTVRYTPEQNGKAERLNRTLLDRVRAMLEDSKLPKTLWAEAAVTASYLRNRAPAAGRSCTPWEAFFGNKPDVSHLRVFGARAYALQPKELRRKLDSHAIRGVMVGYEPNVKGYRILTDDGKVIVAGDVAFDETTGGAQRPGTTSVVPKEHVRVAVDSDGSGSNGEDNDAATDGDADEAASDDGADHVAPARRYPTRQRRPPGDWWAGQQALQATAASGGDPTTLAEALASENAPHWQQAMDDEIASLAANNTWTLEEAPPGVRPIPVKWVFKTKRNVDGNVERYKARLVAKGFRQLEGVDFTEVFAPVSKHATLRALLARVAHYDMELHQLDIKTAFLNGQLEEEVYVEQPPGYVGGGAGKVCRLHRALYGLKQAPRAWHKRLSEELDSLGFTASSADAGLYTKLDVEAGGVFVIVYVDDMLIAANSMKAVDAFKATITAAFDAHDLGEAAHFLGMAITRDRSARTIKLDQKTMAAQLVSKYGLDDGKPRGVPLSKGIELSRDTGEALNKDVYTYTNLVGSMLYMSVCTRPDIAQAVGALSKFMAAPTTTHWQAATGVLRYLAGTKGYGITYGASAENIVGYTDADYAGDVDTRRSTTGFVFILFGGAVSWSSKRQATVAASTTEAEYIAIAAAVREALWLRQLLKDLSMGVDTVDIFADNQSAIKLVKNPVVSNRSKHIDVVYHFARERVTRKDVKIAYVKTDDMLADMLTKPVAKAKLDLCNRGIGMG